MEEKLIDYLDGNLSEQKALEVEQYLLANPSELEGLGILSEKLAQLTTPAPSVQMRQNFYQNLAAWKQEEQARELGGLGLLKNWWQQLLQSIWLPRIAFGCTLLLGGVWIGYQMRGNESLEQLEAMTHKTQQMQKVLMMSMLEQHTATKRIKAVSMAETMVHTDAKVVEVLVHTLNNDDNVNVRITAAETLGKFIELPTVQRQLIASLAQQESPLVQLTLVDALLQLRDKPAMEALQKLVNDLEVNEAIRMKAKQGLQAMDVYL